MLKDTFIGAGYDAQLIDRQFQCATVKNRNDLLRRQTWDTSNKVPFIIQYFPGTEKLHHSLCSLQPIINDDEHLTKIFPMPPLLTFKQPPNLKQTIVLSKLPSLQDNIDHNTIQPYNGNLCKKCQIFDMDATITCGNTTHHMHGRYSCDSANVVHFICCRQGCPEAWYIGKTMQTLQKWMNGHCITIARQGCSVPVREHFSGQRHLASDLQVNILQGGLQDTQQCRVAEQKLIAKFGTHEDGLNRDV
eukprot:g37777.t1